MGTRLYFTNTVIPEGDPEGWEPYNGVEPSTNMNTLVNHITYDMSLTANVGSTTTYTMNDTNPVCGFRFIFYMGSDTFSQLNAADIYWDFDFDPQTTGIGGTNVWSASNVYVINTGYGGFNQVVANIPGDGTSSYPWGQKPSSSITQPLPVIHTQANYNPNPPKYLTVVLEIFIGKEPIFNPGTSYDVYINLANSYLELPFDDYEFTSSEGVVAGGVAEESIATISGYRPFDIRFRNPASLDIYFKDLAPVIWYPMTPQGTETLYDIIGTAHGTLTNFESYITPWGAYQDRYYLEVDPEVDLWEPGSLGTHVSVPYSSVWASTYTTNFTITFWYAPRTTGIPSLGEDHACLINYGGDDTGHFISLYDDGDSLNPYFSFVNGTTKVLDSGVASSLNTWTHVACVVKNNFMGIYINGVLANSRTDIDIDVVPDFAMTGNRNIGILTTSNFLSYVGKLSDIKVYNLGLSPDQVLEMYEEELDQRSKRSAFDLLGDP